MTWSSIKAEGAPVRGFVSEFDSAVTQWRAAASDGETLRSQFKSIVDGSDLTFEGDAAKAFQELVKEAQLVLDDVPVVCTSISTILSDHATKLKSLWAEADAALARAKVAQADRSTAASQAASANARIASIKRQIDQLRTQPPEQSAGPLATLEQQLRTEESTSRSKATAAATAESCIRTELGNWQSLRDREDSLNRSTADQIGKIDLKSLANPSNLERAYKAVEGFVNDKVVGFFKELAHNIDGFIDSIKAGDWGQALWHLRGVLDAIGTILSIAALVVIAVCVVAGGIATGGALLYGLAIAGAVVAGAKFATTAAIVGGDIENKETGERLGIVDLAVDGAAFITSLVGLKGAQAVVKGPGGSVVYFRQAAAEHNVVMKNFGQLSYKQTAKAVAKEVGEEVRDAVFEEARERLLETETAQDAARAVGQSVGYDGQVIKSPPTKDPRLSPIMKDIQAVKDTGRGMNAPVQTVLVGTY